MAPSPTHTKQYTVQSEPKDFSNLKLDEKVPLPELGQHDVLVQWKYVSLNYRDLIISKGTYPFPAKTNVIPASDGAGTVLAVGPNVTRFQPGDDVVSLFNQGHIAGVLTPALMSGGTGGAVDGVLRQYAVWSEENLVASPKNLDLKEASTLSCAALTAWNALYGVEGRQLRPGQTVLTQGTGGVSIFALQFAKAAGACVIATTSSAEKAKTLKDLGADHVINYKENKDWGDTAQKLTPHGHGVDFVVEIGGPETMKQSLTAIKREGIITIIGFLAGRPGPDQPGFLDVLTYGCLVRGVLVGSRIQFEEMNAAIEGTNIKPVVDDKVFSFEKLQEAYQYMWDQNHFGKLTVKID